MKQYLSPSEMFLWYYDKEKYIDQYVKGIKQEANDKMKIGTMIHKCAEDIKYDWLQDARELGFHGKKVKNLRKIIDIVQTMKKPAIKELAIRATTKSGIKLFGIIDAFDGIRPFRIDEYKTSNDNSKWYQKRADTLDQFSIYAYMLYLNYHAYFSEMRIVAIDYEHGTVKKLYTARGYRDIEYIKEKIENFVAELKKEGIWEKRLSRKEMQQINQQTLL